MKRKRILFLSQMFPYPPVSGGLIKTLNTITVLSREYDIHAVFITDEVPSSQSIRKLTSLGIRITYFVSKNIRATAKEKFWEMMGSFARGIPHYVFQYAHTPVFGYVSRLIVTWKPDVIHVDHLNMAQYLPKKKRQVWILEHHNVETNLYWTRLLRARKWTMILYLLIETPLTYWYERRMVPTFDHIFAISKPEEMRTRRMFHVEHVSTQPFVYKTSALGRRRHAGKRILFVGVLSWPPNEDAVRWFIDKIFPDILKRAPDAQFHVVGRLGLRYVPQSTTNIFVHGFQRDITPFLAFSDVFVLPFRVGGGLRLKALTALSNGLPVVTTPLGIEGISVRNEIECLNANSPDSFAAAVVRVLHSPLLQDKLRIGALRYMNRAYGEHNNERFMRLYRAVTQRCG